MTVKSRGKASQKTPRDSKSGRSSQKEEPSDLESYFKGWELEDTLETIKLFQEESKEVGKRYEENAAYLRKLYEAQIKLEEAFAVFVPATWEGARLVRAKQEETQAVYEEATRIFLCQ